MIRTAERRAFLLKWVSRIGLKVRLSTAKKEMRHSKSPQAQLVHGRAVTSCTSHLQRCCFCSGSHLAHLGHCGIQSVRQGRIHILLALHSGQHHLPLTNPSRCTSLVVGLQGGDVIGLTNSSHDANIPPHWRRGSWGRSQASPAGTCSTPTCKAPLRSTKKVCPA